IRPFQAVDTADQGALAGAAHPDDAVDLAGAHLQIDAPQGLDPPVFRLKSLVDTLESNDDPSGPRGCHLGRGGNRSQGPVRCYVGQGSSLPSPCSGAPVPEAAAGPGSARLGRRAVSLRKKKASSRVKRDRKSVVWERGATREVGGE